MTELAGAGIPVTVTCRWHRLHSSIGYLTPIEKENEYYRETNPQSQPALGELALQ